jgi:hypothetical protein
MRGDGDEDEIYLAKHKHGYSEIDELAWHTKYVLTVEAGTGYCLDCII